MPNIDEKPTLPKYIGFLLGAVVVLGVLAFGGWHLYHKWEPRRLAKRAKVLLDQGDVKSAGLTVRHAFSIDPSSAPALRVAAEICEKEENADAVTWRTKLAELSPHSLAPAMECAITALHYAKPQVARTVLERVKGEGEANPLYHDLSGRTAAALGQPDAAIAHFAATVRLDPKNESSQVSYAAALLERGWLEDRTAARGTLERLQASPAVHEAATRALLRDSLAEGELTGALGLARDLAGKKEANFSDRLTLVDLLRRRVDPGFPSALAALKTDARGHPTQVADLLVWMNRSERAAEALAWVNAFAPEEWADPRVGAAVALNCLTLKAWPELEGFTRGNWHNLEYLRCALRARSLAEQGKLDESYRQWEAATNAAADQPDATRKLANFISDWGWTPQWLALLRTAAGDQKVDDSVFPLLFNQLARAKNTEALFEVTTRFAAKHPENDAAANNLALYSLLLGRSVQTSAAMAQQLHERHPREAKYVSTYAYSLQVLGQPEQALRVLQALPPEELERPDIAAYYGIVLAATGHREQASHFLDLARAADLLPEEQLLVRTARGQVGLGSP